MAMCLAKTKCNGQQTPQVQTMRHQVFRGSLSFHLQPDRCLFHIVTVAIEEGANAAFHDIFCARNRDK